MALHLYKSRNMTYLLALVLHVEFKRSISSIILTISILLHQLNVYISTFCKRNNTYVLYGAFIALTYQT